MPNSYSVRRRHFFIAMLVAALGLSAVPASAQFDDAQLGCRKAVSKGAAKLAKTVGKTIGGCHKGRLSGKVSEANDCNDLDAAETDLKQKVSGTETKVADKIAGAKGKCVGLDPAAMGYNGCPSPCDAAVPSVTDMSDVAQCLICLVETDLMAMAANALGTPSVAASKDDAKCHGTIAKTQGKHFDTILKERLNCQNAAEKGGATDLTGCANTDPKGKIAGARSKGEAGVSDKCAAADLNAVGSCATTNTNDLNACVFDDSATRGETVFEYMYEFGPPTFTAVHNMMLASGCTNPVCHGFDPGQATMNLSDYDGAYDEFLLEGVFCFGSSFTSRVVPFDTANSFLVAKLEGTQDCGLPMPNGMPPLTPAQIDLVKGWILDGAQKN